MLQKNEILRMLAYKVLERFSQQKKVLFGNIPIQPSKNKNLKIQLNKQIQGLMSKQHFLQFYQEHQSSMNLVNQVSYLRRFTDQQINQDSLVQSLAHTMQVFKTISNSIINEEYKVHHDKPRDLARCFSMLLSLQCIVHSKTKDDSLLIFARQTISEIAKNNMIKLFNDQETSSFIRCVSLMVDIVDDSEQELFQKELTRKNLENYDLKSLCKIFHSISKLKKMNETLDQRVFNNIIRKLERRDEILRLNSLDISSIYIGLKAQLKQQKEGRKMNDLLRILEKQIHQNTIQLSAITIGVIYNFLSGANEYAPEESFLQYLEQQFSIIPLENMNIKILAHAFKFFEISKRELDGSCMDKVEQFIETVEIKDVQEAELFFLFFKSICMNNVNLKIVNRATSIMKELQTTSNLNSYCIQHLLITLCNLKITNSSVRELISSAMKFLEEEEVLELGTISLVLNASSQFLFNDYQDRIMKMVEVQLRRNGREIIVEEFFRKELEHLAVLQNVVSSLQNAEVLSLVEGGVEELVGRLVREEGMGDKGEVFRMYVVTYLVCILKHCKGGREMLREYLRGRFGAEQRRLIRQQLEQQEDQGYRELFDELVE